MNTNLINFSYNDTPVRVVTLGNEPWFVMNDVAKVLELANPRSSLALLDEDEKGVHSMDTLGGAQEVAIISEAGLYSLILRSRKTEAKQFKRWVTHEVLPSIRKHGGYVAGQEQMSPEEMVLASLKFLQSKVTEQQARIDQMRPKEIFADAVATSKTSILIGDLAKILKGNGVNIGAQRLFRWLRDNKYLIRRKGIDWNTPTQKAMELGLFEVKETAITHSDGHVTVSKTPKVTGKGQQYFVNKFLAEKNKGVA